ncbi:DNA polymerase III subunit beta [Tardibacter chloracetimidivorans]|uniref:Beta sliding clamp n=1 Tax=Tardibacter chloracetimidivorans TaxID=1921510 RepID=A0A1L3ZRP4_9SPHN|nr:DNA polymerase III subunit beta [Tardibacter chloracetimidivorans]API58304.1 DNA polymerase III subunit beta [Tardibacter chloracetimidivorans]
MARTAAKKSAPEAPPITTATVKRHDLADALSLVASVAPRRATIPVLEGVLIETGNARLRLTCTDLDTRITTAIDCDGVLNAPVIVSAAMLRDVAKTLAGDQASLALDDGKLVITARNGGKRRLWTMPVEDFPDISLATPDNAVTMPRDLLAKALGNVAPAQSAEETRYYLNGIHIHPEPGQGGQDLRLVATDGSRLHLDRVELAEFDDEAWPDSAILPTRVITTLIGLLKAAGEDVTDIGMEISARHCRFTVGDVTLWSRLIDGTFPDYRRIVPGSLPIQFECPAAELVRAIAAVEPVATEKTRAVRLQLGTATSSVCITTAEGGEAIEPIDDAQLRMADEIAIGFNARLLKSALQLFGGERATIELSDAGSQARLSCPAHPGLTIILMPMRI